MVDTPQANPPIAIQAPSVLLMGGPGSGKTHSIVTLAKAGLDVFVVVTEPNGLDTLLDVFQANNLMDKLHWAHIQPSRPGFDHLLQAAKTISLADQEILSKQKPSTNRGNAQFIQLLQCLKDFRCARTGKSYGPVDAFDDSKALIVDSLSGLNLMAMDLTIGDKVTASPGEWNIAMTTLERLILKLTSDIKCPFALIAHLEKEQDEISGATRIMASSLGRKLAPKLPRFFSEVVMSYRQGDQFYWSTSTSNVDLKKRSLPLAEKLPPTFEPIVEAYRKRIAGTSAT